MEKQLVTEEQAREMVTCPGCKDQKDRGSIVCWNCFKYCANPLKYFDGTFEQWLGTVR